MGDEKQSAKKREKKHKDEHQQKAEELTDALKRTQAEFENYKKRVERDREQQAKYSSEHIIKRFLPILDNLELALQHCTQKDDFYKGVEMIYANIRSMLEEEGVSMIQAQGLPFDPYRHEALMSVASEEEKNTVIDVMQQGYELHEKVIRPAKVTISKGKGQ